MLLPYLKISGIGLLLALLPLKSFAVETVKFTFSVNYYNKTCEVVAPDTVTIENSPGSGTTSTSSIKSETATVPFTIKLANCNSTDLSNTGVYLSQGTVLTGTNNFFNRDAAGVIGIQITEGEVVYSINSSAGLLPSSDSVIWKNITNSAQTKTLNASLKCKTKDCEPPVGDFSAGVTLSFYSE